MKKLFTFLFFIAFICSFSQTTIPGGNVSGIWTLAGSPYQVTGSIQILNGQTLTINPGVRVDFQGHYKLLVSGRLLSIGTIADTIVFTATNTSTGWFGIRFDNTPLTNDTSKIYYSKLQYGKATGTMPDDDGGAIYFNDFSKALVSNCRIINCTANTYGGGIACFDSSPILSNNTISSNTGGDGGGIYCASGISGSSPTISNNNISNNTGGNGGGIACGSSPNISNNIITNNTASFWGGGIFCNNSGFPSITNNAISNNTAESGGGISYSGGSPTNSNNTITNNTATNNGGGIHCIGSSPNISNNSISNNSAVNGGALYCENNSDPTLRNTILWGNTATTSGTQIFLYDDASDPNFYYSDAQGGTSAFEINGGFYTGSYLGNHNIDVDPKFLSPSGGSGTGFNGVTANWSLQSSSPCIDQGDPSGIYPATDLANNPRVRPCRIDMGAYEYQSGAPLSATITQTQQIICHGDASAVLSANPLGGTPSDTYLYSWDNGSTTQSVSGLAAGVHSVTVTTTISQCQAITSYTITESSPIILTPSHKDDNGCNAINDGYAQMVVSGGVSPYTFQWSTGNSTWWISGLAAGNYSLTLTDNIGCAHTNTITIGTLSTTITPNLISKPDTCTGHVGAITASPTGGLGAYTYAWSNNSSAQNISGLSPGNYSVTISDSLGCLMISSPAVGIYTSTITPTLTSIPDTCTGNVGRAISNPTGGTAPYTYLWSNTGSTKNISSLASNSYSITITDKNGCSTTGSILVTSFTNTITPTLTSAPDTCTGNVGRAMSNPSGGTAPYTYLWSNNGSTKNISSLASNNYSVTITDKNGCSAISSVSVGVFTSTLSISFNPVSASCHNANGSITANPSGGTNPYSYVWSNGISSQTATNLFAGNYSVSITDKHGCAGTNTSTVGTSSTIATPNICMVTVDSLSQNNVIMWDKTPYSHIDSFIVCRETSANIYKPIGAVPYDSLSVFVDTVRTKYFPNTGNPNAGTYRYKIQMVDSCGNHSVLSPFHNTIYIINNSGTFSWPQLYTIEGSSNPVSNYVLMRDNNSNGNWITVSSVTGSQQTVTDPQYSTYQSTASWRVETQWSISCTPTHIKNPEVFGFNSSRSNIFHSTATGADEYYNNSSVSIYPNPFSETTTLRIANGNRTANYSLAVTDIYGKIIYSDAISNANEFEIHRNNLPGGMYFYKVTGGAIIIATGKLVIE